VSTKPGSFKWGPTSLINLSAYEFYQGDTSYGDFYGLAGHFVTYLRETHGVDRLMAFMRDAEKEGVATTFVDRFDYPLEEAESRWRADSPRSYEVGDPCRELIELSAEGFEVEQSLGCQDPESLNLSASGSFESTRGYCFDIQEPTRFEFRTDSANGEARVYSTQCWDTSSGLATGMRIASAYDVETLAGCRWKLDLTSAAAGDSIVLAVEYAE